MASAIADLVLHDGAVLGHPESDAVAIAGGRIAAHGSFGALRPMMGSKSRLIRLGGRTVAPGFIDCHLHFLEAAAVNSGPHLGRCRGIGQLLDELRLAAAKTPPGNWLRAFGCDESLLYEHRGPTRDELDRSASRNPLRLRHQTLHASWLNSRAIKLLGLERADFIPPAGAWLERDASGRLTGFVVGMEEWLTRNLPVVTSAELEARARMMSRELAAAGVTSFTDATVRNGPDEFKLYALLVQGGAIRQRVSLMLGAPHLDSAFAVRATAERAGFRLGGVKFVERAESERELATLGRRAARALALGLDCCFHVTELPELESAVSAFERAKTSLVKKETGATLRLEHAALITPDYLERIAAAGAWVITNPGFLHFRAAKYLADPGLIPHLYRAHSLSEAGIALAAGTDAPVTPAKPLVAIAAAVSRQGLEGQDLAPDERLSIGEAFSLFTSAAARISRLEAGELTVGAHADLIVLPKNPLTLSPAELINLPVDITIIGGQVVYERGRPEFAHSSSAELFST